MARMRRICFGFGLSFLLLACNAQDPGVEGLTRGEFNQEGGLPSSDAGGADAAPKEGGADASDGSTVATAFTGAPTFTSTTPPTSAVMQHNNNNIGVTPGKGVDCLSCHKQGGAGTPFLFAGTVFQDQNGNTPASGKEIRVRGTDGKGYIANSDSDGNFWYKPGTGETVAYPAQSGARDATQTALMVATITAGSCNANQCHDGNTQLYIHLP